MFGEAHSAKHTWDKLNRSLGSKVMSGLPTQVRMVTGKMVPGKEADEQWHKTSVKSTAQHIDGDD